jgi:hypothetical protein
MRVVTIVTVEECLDGTSVHELVLSEPADRDLAERLSRLGEMDYYADFPRPFFRVTADAVQIKGVAGSDRIRLWLSSSQDRTAIARVTEAIEHR